MRAGIAQLVERNLAKVEVASSNLVSRSNPFVRVIRSFYSLLKRIDDAEHQGSGRVAEWLCSGLQSRVRRFDSDPGLHV